MDYEGASQQQQQAQQQLRQQQQPLQRLTAGYAEAGWGRAAAETVSVAHSETSCELNSEIVVHH